ncbi:unnamed protein product [Ceutorhynchus assimilis]|uniref:Uncharacterized protein n=1 Tax=Ceutorhynchus assimilis TaxID=467358 RepID=A0A9N9MGC5_9CUCU|nr:unnamed protein product [Ceutorhynchus assimilis]
MSEIDFGQTPDEPIKKSFAGFDQESARTNTDSIWGAIMNKYNEDREELEQYIKKRDNTEDEASLHHLPVIVYLNKEVFPVLCEALIAMLGIVTDENSFNRQKSAFHGIDYLSEYLHNKNPKHPDRRNNWTYIFDMDWVNDYLQHNPRPYYPFSLIWSREYAAVKIQSFLRGYWVRRRDDVQEVRTFWKDYKLSKQNEAIQLF